jgi:large subunit ribosomal protein L6
MSRIGKQLIPIPAKVTVKVAGGNVHVEGPKGKLDYQLPEGITVTQEGTSVSVHRSSDVRIQKALHGTAQRLITNMVQGVSQGFRKVLASRASRDSQDLESRRRGKHEDQRGGDRQATRRPVRR